MFIVNFFETCTEKYFFSKVEQKNIQLQGMTYTEYINHNPTKKDDAFLGVLLLSGEIWVYNGCTLYSILSMYQYFYGGTMRRD